MVRDDRDEPVRVLIVENDARVRAGLRAFLGASPGFDLVGDTGSAAVALELARERAPTVALVDVLLPDACDGLDLMRALTLELQIPAVAISIQSGLRSSALSAGAREFLDKDSSPDRLLAALRAAAPGWQGQVDPGG